MMSDMTGYTLYNSIYERNKSKPDNIAVEYLGRRITYQEYFQAVALYSSALKNLGVTVGKNVVLCLPSVPEFVCCFSAINNLGGVCVVPSPKYLITNPARYIDWVEADLLIILDKYLEAGFEGIIKTGVKTIVVVSIGDSAPVHIESALGGKSSDFLDKLLKNRILPEGIKILCATELVDDVTSNKMLNNISYFDKDIDASIVFTSGTTGEPKGVIYTNANYIKMCHLYEAGNIESLTNGRMLVSIPPFHATILVHVYWLPMMLGGTLILRPNYDKSTYADDLRSFGATATFAPPSHYAAAIASGLQSSEISTLKYLLCGGEYATRKLVKHINENWGVPNPFIIGFGSSETGPMTLISHNVPDVSNRVGKPLPGVEARIVDPKTGAVLGPNQRGKIQAKTPCFMKGYYKDAEATKRYFTEDGFAQYHDIAVMDDDGVYYVLGRAADSFAAPDGSTVYLFDIENVIDDEAETDSFIGDSVWEWEAITVCGEDGHKRIPVVFLVINPEYEDRVERIIRKLDVACKKELSNPYAVPCGWKIIDAFQTDKVTDKRDTASLQQDKDGFLLPSENGLCEVSI